MNCADSMQIEYDRSAKRARVNDAVIVSWGEIVAIFKQKFDRERIGRYAYFDSYSLDSKEKAAYVIEDAREKWCFPLLLDAVICLYRGYDVVVDSRRAFNQHAVLHQTVEQYLFPETYDLSHHLVEFQLSRYYDAPWNSFVEFRAMMEGYKKGLTMKAKIKMSLLLNSLCPQEVDLDMKEVLNVVFQNLWRNILERNRLLISSTIIPVRQETRDNKTDRIPLFVMQSQLPDRHIRSNAEIASSADCAIEPMPYRENSPAEYVHSVNGNDVSQLQRERLCDRLDRIEERMQRSARCADAVHAFCAAFSQDRWRLSQPRTDHRASVR